MTGLSVSQPTPENSVTLTWTDPTSGPRATDLRIWLDTVASGQTTKVDFVQCGPTCTVTHLRALTPGTTYQAEVYTWNASGYSPAAWSPALTLSNTCPGSTCLSINTTTTGPAIGGGDNGLLDAVFPQQGTDLSSLTKLKTRTFRGAPGVSKSGVFDWRDWYQIASTGAHMDLLLSAIWLAEDQSWSGAANYETWVQQTMKTVAASGQRVDSVEPLNEPNGYESIGDLETQFGAAYQGIEASDPSAAVIGPSFSRLVSYADQYGQSTEPTMGDFLAWANAQNIKLAAVSWHEIADYLGPLPSENTLSAQNLVDNVTAARALVARYPKIGHPQVWINEYGMAEVSDSAGWDVRYLAALEQAGVPVAGASCWDVHCANPDFDGLLTLDGSAPTSAYWVYQAYGSMTGTLDPTTTTDGTAAVLASTANGTTTALIGKGVSCVDSAYNDYCKDDWKSPPLATPAPLKVTIRVPSTWTSATVNLTDLGSAIDSAFTPSAGTTTAMAVTNGLLTLTTPAISDGEALRLTVSQAGTSGHSGS